MWTKISRTNIENLVKQTVDKIFVEIWSDSLSNSKTVNPEGKNYLKLFGESLFKTIKNYSNSSPMLNWPTIGGTIGRNDWNK